MKTIVPALLAFSLLLAACAPPTPAPTSTPIPPTATFTPVPLVRTNLVELQPVSAQVGFWEPGFGVYPGDGKGMSRGQVIMAQGKTYQYGIFAHAPSVLIYDLGGRYKTFTTEILEQETACGDGAVFVISLDEVEAFRSQPVTAATPPQTVELDVTGANTLKLSIERLAQGLCDWTIWGDPYLMGEPLPVIPTLATP